MLERVQWHRCVNLKNAIIALLKDSSTASWLPNFLRWFFICLTQLNSSRHVKCKTLLDMSETSSFKSKIQQWIHRIENGWICAFLAVNAFAEKVEIYWLCICQIFLNAFQHLSAMDRYIPSHNHIKTFNWVRSSFEAGVAGSLWSRLHFRTADWAAKSTAVESDPILSGCPDNGTKYLWSVSAGNKSSCFSTTYRCEAVFQR